MVIYVDRDMIPEFASFSRQAGGQAGQATRTILESHRQADYGLVAADARAATEATRALRGLQVFQDGVGVKRFGRLRCVIHGRSACGRGNVTQLTTEAPCR